MKSATPVAQTEQCPDCGCQVSATPGNVAALAVRKTSALFSRRCGVCRANRVVWHAGCSKGVGTIMKSKDKDSPKRPTAEMAATQAESEIRARDEARFRGRLGSLASVSKRASSRPTAKRATTGLTTENRPPEAWRAVISKAGAGAEHSVQRALIAAARDFTTAPLERASAGLGANKAEARVSRLLSSAGLHVSVREVMGRSGLGPEASRALLNLALAPVRARSERQRATLYEVPRRSPKDDPLS